MLNSTVLTILIGIIAVKLLKWLFKYAKLCWIVNKIPGPFMVPVLGNALSFSADGFIHQLIAISKKYATFPIFRLWIGPHFWIVFHKPEQLEKVFSEPTFSGKAFEYDFLIPWIGKGLIVSQGPKWQHRRRLISPTFSTEILNGFFTVFNDQSMILVDLLKNLAKYSKQFDIIPYVSNCALDILCETVMGINVNAQGAEHSKYVDAVLKIGPILFQRPVNPLYWPNFVWENTSLGKEYNEHLRNLHEFTRKVIEERNTEFENLAESKNRKIAFLDLLLKVKQEQQDVIDLNGIKEEVDTFMFAGHDTSANTLSWAIYLIATHPDVQKKLQAEVDAVFGNSNRHLSNQDLNELKYLDCVVNETLRLFPPAPFLGRSISNDCEIDGYKIPKGGTAIILTYMLHRDERFFPNPDNFVPERFFSPTLKENLPTYAYIPFSAGPRLCIGKKFAQLSIKIILAHMIRHFHIESTLKAGELKGAMDLLLRPELPVMISIKERV